MSTTLSFEMEKTAAWRDEKAERYPSDWRNEFASEHLRKLARMGQDEVMSAKYEELGNSVSEERWSEAHSSILGSIGFSFKPTHVDEVLASLIASLDENAPPVHKPQIVAPSPRGS